VSSENLIDVVVEVDVAGTQMASEHRRVRREDCSDVDVTRPTDDQSHAGDPLVEVCHQVRRRASHLLLILHTHTHTHTPRYYCAVELNTQNCAWFGYQISLL